MVCVTLLLLAVGHGQSACTKTRQTDSDRASKKCQCEGGMLCNVGDSWRNSDCQNCHCMGDWVKCCSVSLAPTDLPPGLIPSLDKKTCSYRVYKSAQTAREQKRPGLRKQHRRREPGDLKSAGGESRDSENSAGGESRDSAGRDFDF
ncbi:uncharacterized protein msmp2 [Scyliorhinus torazame]|uniref:uncharacterized protein msmp2 n=1 Tax=Scyliorhinus torazame TaxID=75743 RepID=UPI003B5C553F